MFLRQILSILGWVLSFGPHIDSDLQVFNRSTTPLEAKSHDGHHPIVIFPSDQNCGHFDCVETCSRDKMDSKVTYYGYICWLWRAWVDRLKRSFSLLAVKILQLLCKTRTKGSHIIPPCVAPWPQLTNNYVFRLWLLRALSGGGGWGLSGPPGGTGMPNMSSVIYFPTSLCSGSDRKCNLLYLLLLMLLLFEGGRFKPRAAPFSGNPQTELNSIKGVTFSCCCDATAFEKSSAKPQNTWGSSKKPRNWLSWDFLATWRLSMQFLRSVFVENSIQ